MKENIATNEDLTRFREYLTAEEKSPVTIEKYMRDAGTFVVFAEGREVTKELTVCYKQSLVEKKYAVRSVNSMLAGLNSFLEFMGWKELKVKSLRQQKQIYCAAEKELTKAEYLRLLEASVKQEQLNMIIQTICGTGIRVSELKYFTVEGVRHGEIMVQCKNKNRTVLVPGKLRKRLLDFAKKHK